LSIWLSLVVVVVDTDMAVRAVLEDSVLEQD
jgi:hypothetical protein